MSVESNFHHGVERIQLTQQLDIARRARNLLRQQIEAENAQYKGMRENDKTFIGVSPNTQNIASRILSLSETINKLEKQLENLE